MSHLIRIRPIGTTPPPRDAAWRRSTAVLAAAVLGFGLLGTATPAAHAAESFFCADGTQPYAPAAEVEAFAAGESVAGLSVTHGTTPEAFSGAYVGFIDNALGKDKDLLLFRLSSPVIDGTESSGGLKGTGIWAGMSGSPVYTTDGRLIGAVAYRLTSENLPIAGVTPAEYLKSIGTTALGTSARVRVTNSNLRTSAAGTSAAGTTLVGSTFSQVRTVNVAGSAGARQNAFANRTLARTPRSADAGAFLRSGGFLPAAAANSSAVTAPLVAGGTLAVTYTSGDLLIGAVGTVTAVCGETVWGFGHPMAYEGEASLLMANASTAMIVPDGAGLSGSYKQVSQFGAPVGMITQDRRAGIRGTVGVVKAFGIDVDVENASGAQVASYHVGVADPEVAASAAAGITGQAAYEQLDQFSSGTGEVTWTIGFRREDGSAGSLTNSQVVADRYFFPDVVATELADQVWAIVDNEFEEVAITGIQVTLRLLDADATSYKATDVQLLKNSGWASLSGTRLKAGKSYTIRPEYRIQKNGKLRASVFGDPVKVKLASTARKSGTFSVAPANAVSEECEVDSSGNVFCIEWGDGSVESYGSFDELIASLDEFVPASSVVGELRYHRKKKGSAVREFTWTGPGVVTGAAEADFSIRR